MRTTVGELRRVIREAINDDEVDRALEAAAAAADAFTEESKDKHWFRGAGTWHWQKAVTDALKPFGPPREPPPAENATRREFLRAVMERAHQKDRDRGVGDDWTGYTFVAAVLNGEIAWMTPGFARAKRMHDYGM